MAFSYQKVVCNRNEIYYSTVHDIYSDAGITDLMGGNLGVFSEGLGRGCTFLLELPTVSPPLAAKNPMGLMVVRKSLVVESNDVLTNDELLHDLHNASHKVRLLIVDDSFFCRKMVSQLLQKFNVDCEEAIDGEAAVKRIHAATKSPDDGFDGIIMDREMPVMNGLQAVKAIRGLGFDGRIYGCSGDIDPKMEAAFVAAGANRSYLKPLTNTDFIAMLRGKLRSGTYCSFSVDLSESLRIESVKEMEMK